jgi:histidyl-tRNA synthetase
MAKLAAPSGFRDFLPEEYRKRQELIGRIRATYESFGFEGMDTPAMENLQVFLGKAGGENEKLMFRVLKRGAELERAVAAGRGELADLALRFDLTVPLARYYATHRAALPAVFKRYQIGTVWRAERAQHGRFREFVQCDVDVLGSASMAVEAEVILATTTALARLGFEGLVVRLNARPLLALLVRSAGVPDEHLGAAVIGIDKLDKESPDAVRAELAGKGVPEAAAAALLDFHARSRSGPDDALLDEVASRVGPAGGGLVAQLRDVLSLTPSLPSGRLVFDPFLARGMDYYTGPIFEIAAAGVPFSLAGGGRFDDLVERLAGVRVPACGFSIGFERVYTLMEERGMFGDGARAADVLVAVPATEATADALRLAAELRAGELRVDGFPHAGKLGPQFELAERKGIPFAVVADPEKLRAGTLEVRQLASRQSAMVARTELIAWLRTRLVSPRG